MCRMCHKYGKRLQMQPINALEQKAWNLTVGAFGYEVGYGLFMFWHKWFVKD